MLPSANAFATEDGMGVPASLLSSVAASAALYQGYRLSGIRTGI
jgi:hypothetical protein